MIDLKINKVVKSELDKYWSHQIVESFIDINDQTKFNKNKNVK